jgi:hypothetical protein
MRVNKSNADNTRCVFICTSLSDYTTNRNALSNSRHPADGQTPLAPLFPFSGAFVGFDNPTRLGVGRGRRGRRWRIALVGGQFGRHDRLLL